MLSFILPMELQTKLQTYLISQETENVIYNTLLNTRHVFVRYEISCSEYLIRILSIECFDKYQKLLNFNTESIPEMGSDFSKWYNWKDALSSGTFSFSEKLCDDLCRK